MLRHHPFPRARIAVLKGEALGIGAVAEDHWIAAVLDRAKDVGPQHQPVIHLDRNVPVDAHAVALFTAHFVGARRLDGWWHFGSAVIGIHRFPPSQRSRSSVVAGRELRARLYIASPPNPVAPALG